MTTKPKPTLTVDDFARAYYDTEWRRRFAAKKAKQSNNGSCAAIIVDCDCDLCLYNDTNKEMRSWRPPIQVRAKLKKRFRCTFEGKATDGPCGNVIESTWEVDELEDCSKCGGCSWEELPACFDSYKVSHYVRTQATVDEINEEDVDDQPEGWLEDIREQDDIYVGEYYVLYGHLPSEGFVEICRDETEGDGVLLMLYRLTGIQGQVGKRDAYVVGA